MLSSKPSDGVHIVAVLAFDQGEPVTSARLILCSGLASYWHPRARI
jgi:hypothetical protein